MPNSRSEDLQRQLQKRSAHLLKKATVPIEVIEIAKPPKMNARKSTHTFRKNTTNSSTNQQTAKDPKDVSVRKKPYNYLAKKINNKSKGKVKLKRGRKPKSEKLIQISEKCNSSVSSTSSTPSDVDAIKKTLNDMKFKLGQVLKTKKNIVDKPNEITEAPTKSCKNKENGKCSPKCDKMLSPNQSQLKESNMLKPNDKNKAKVEKVEFDIDDTPQKSVELQEINAFDYSSGLSSNNSINISEGRGPSEDAGSEEGLKLWLDETSASSESADQLSIKPDYNTPINFSSRVVVSYKNELNNKMNSKQFDSDVCHQSITIHGNDVDDAKRKMNIDGTTNKQLVVLLEHLPTIVMEHLSNVGSVQIIQLTSGNKELDFFTVSNHLHPCRQEQFSKKLESKKVSKVPEISVIDGIEFYSFETEDALIAYTIEEQKLQLASGAAVIGSDVSDADLYSYVQPIIPTKTNDITKIKGWRNKVFAAETTQVKEMSEFEEVKTKDCIKETQLCKNLSPTDCVRAGFLNLMKQKYDQQSTPFTIKKMRKQNRLDISECSMDINSEECASIENTLCSDDMSSTESVSTVFNEESENSDRELDEDNSQFNQEINKDEEESEEREDAVSAFDDKRDNDYPLPRFIPHSLVNEIPATKMRTKRQYMKKKVTERMKKAGPFKTIYGWFQKFNSVCVPVGSVTDECPSFSPLNPFYQYKAADKAKLRLLEKRGLEISAVTLADKGIISPLQAELAVSALKEIKSDIKQAPIVIDNNMQPVVKTIIKIDETKSSSKVARSNQSLGEDLSLTSRRLSSENEVTQQVTDPESSDIEIPRCGQRFCRYGCVCDSLRIRKRKRSHCGKVDCMFVCVCGFTITAKGDSGTRTSISSPISSSNCAENVQNDNGLIKRRRVSRPPARLMDCDFLCRTTKDINSMPELIREKLTMNMINRRRNFKHFKNSSPAIKRIKYIPAIASAHNPSPSNEPKVPPIRITNLKGNTFPKILRPILPKPSPEKIAIAPTTYKSFQRLDYPLRVDSLESQHVLPCGTTFVDGKVVMNIPKETNARALLTMGEISKGKSSLRFIGLRMNVNPNVLHSTQDKDSIFKDSTTDGAFQKSFMPKNEGSQVVENKMSGRVHGKSSTSQKRMEKVIGYVISKQNLKDAVSLAKLSRSPVSAPVSLAAANFVRFVSSTSTESLAAPQFNIYPIEKSNTHVFVGPFDKILPNVYKDYIKSLVTDKNAVSQNSNGQVETTVKGVMNDMVDKVCELSKPIKPIKYRISSDNVTKNKNSQFSCLTINGGKIVNKAIDPMNRNRRKKRSRSSDDKKSRLSRKEQHKFIKSGSWHGRTQGRKSSRPQLLSAEVAHLAWKRNTELHRQKERNRRQDLEKYMKKLSSVINPNASSDFDWKSKYSTKSHLLKEKKIFTIKKAIRCIQDLEVNGRAKEVRKQALVNRRHSLFLYYSHLLKELPPASRTLAIQALTFQLQQLSNARKKLENNQSPFKADKISVQNSNVTKCGTELSSDENYVSTNSSDFGSSDDTSRKNHVQPSMMLATESRDDFTVSDLVNSELNCDNEPYLERMDDGTDLYMYAEVEEEQEITSPISGHIEENDESDTVMLDVQNMLGKESNEADGGSSGDQETTKPTSVEDHLKKVTTEINELANFGSTNVIELTAESLKSLQKSLGLDKPNNEVIEECFDAVILPSEETSSATDEPVVELPKIIACSTITEAEFLADS